MKGGHSNISNFSRDIRMAASNGYRTRKCGPLKGDMKRDIFFMERDLYLWKEGIQISLEIFEWPLATTAIALARLKEDCAPKKQETYDFKSLLQKSPIKETVFYKRDLYLSLEKCEWPLAAAIVLANVARLKEDCAQKKTPERKRTSSTKGVGYEFYAVAIFGSMLQCVAKCCSVLQCDSLRCSALQCVAVCCNVVRCVVVCCSALQCVAVRCRALQCVAVCYNVLRYVALCFTVVQCSAVCYSVWQCMPVCCSVLQCVEVRCSMLQCGAVCSSVQK